LFCWTCLHKWIDSQQNSLLQCPVCKAGIKHETIIPIYGRGGSSERSKEKPQDVPERPRGQRPEPTRNPNYVPPQPTVFGGSLHFGFGAGGFHFGDGKLFFKVDVRL
jgi:E3 ubiquitin-protein ligase RNF5